MSLSRIRKAVNRLSVMYRNGMVHYPRTDSGYITQQPFGVFPHPPLHGITKPLLKTDYPYSRHTAFLELNNVGLLSPSMLFSTYKKNSMAHLVYKYFNQDMSYKKRHVEELENIVSGINHFMHGFEINKEGIAGLLHAEKKQRDYILIHDVRLSTILEAHRTIRQQEEKNNVIMTPSTPVVPVRRRVL